MLYYYQFDFTKLSGYTGLRTYLDELDIKHGTEGKRAFYLAVAPEHFETIVHGIDVGGLAEPEEYRCRLVIEKPFGKDLATARELNRKLLEVFDEERIYRIDHYLGKEMIQNILVLRFCNTVFESLWNNKFIDNIQISLLEQGEVGFRGDYYEPAGALRDMVQSHLVQILSLVAMEPPVNLDTNSIRNEKLKVVQSLREFTPELLRDDIVFGQYGRGVREGREIKAYREEERVAKDSHTETFVAMKICINNFRWAGTPFYIRTGKSMSESFAEIVIQFKELPNILYFKESGVQEPNLLVIRIQPNVGVFFQFNTRDFDRHNGLVANKMDYVHSASAQGNTPEAYERLILDVLKGDSTLFSRWDEVEASWKFVDRIIEYRENGKFSFPNYEAGSMGPLKAFELLAKSGRQWWHI